MKKIVFLVCVLFLCVAQADIIYTVDLEKRLRPIFDRISALESGQGGSTNKVDLVDITNAVKGVVTKDYVEGLHINISVPATETNVIKQVVTQDFVNNLGFSFRPLNPVTNLVEVTEANEVGDLVETVNTLVSALKQLQEQWKQLQSNSSN